jgi:hypothetical protein
MTRPIGLALALAACVAFAGPTSAQTPQAAPPHETPRLATPDAPKPPPEQIRPPEERPGATGDNSLSDRLSRQQGTLQPPAVDPGIHAPLPAPPGSAMPVIPPPGSPGGDPKIVPK